MKSLHLAEAAFFLFSRTEAPMPFDMQPQSESDPMEYKALRAEFKALEGDEGKYEGHFSIFGNLDDGNDVMEKGAFAKTIQERGKRVKIFFGHDWSKLIGPPPAQLSEDDTGLYAAGKLTLASFWGKEAWALMKDGALTEASIGYEPIKVQYEKPDGTPISVMDDIFFDRSIIRRLKEVKLYEISPVPLGMNALASVRAVKAAMLQQWKSAIPPKKTDMAPEDTEWDAGAVLKDLEGAKQLRMCHAWVDSEGDPESKSSYKLPHHLADGKVCWKGVAAAGTVLMGGRGGPKIPEEDMAGVKKHLETHYKQFEKTAPWSEEAGLDTYVETLTLLAAHVKEGRILSAASKEKVSTAIDALNGALDALKTLLAAAEPEPDKAHSALRHLQHRIRAAELALALR